MLNKPLVRTTIEIEPYLLYHAKLKALEENKTLRDVFTESLKKYCFGKINVQGSPKKNPQVKIGGYNLGGIKGNLNRKNIYADLKQLNSL